MQLYLTSEQDRELYNFLKQKVLTHNSLFYDAIVKDLAIRELISIGMSSSKYKETLRFIEDNQVKGVILADDTKIESNNCGLHLNSLMFKISNHSSKVSPS